jgi:hypothetical protein
MKVTAPSTPTTRSLQEICQAARHANCGECWQKPGKPARTTPKAVRWVAIRHADDHVPIVALLARQDGGKAFVWRDFFQVADACHAAEQRYGLTRRRRATVPERGGRPGPRRRPAGTAGPNRHGSSCGGTQPPQRPPLAASRSSSRCSSRWPVCGSGSGAAAAILGRSPGAPADHRARGVYCTASRARRARSLGGRDRRHGHSALRTVS